MKTFLRPFPPSPLGRLALAGCLLLLPAGLCAQQAAAAAPMTAALAAPNMANDPRVGLSAGLYDAGSAIRNMELVASLHKPDSFSDPNPGGRGGNFTNSDLAFHGNIVIQGNYNGLMFYDASDPAKIKLLTAIVCPGSQGDVSVYGHLVFMSVENQNGRIDCSSTPPPPPGSAPVAGAGRRGARAPIVPNPNRFRGVRIFDVSDWSKPRQVAAIQTCRGSHTHTLVPDPKDKSVIYIYGQGTGAVRPDAELAGCVADPNDPNTSLYSIDIIRVPLAHPEQARIVNRPRVFEDASTGAVNGLWHGGNHGAGTQTSRETSQCHDITVYPAIGLAAGACSGNGILLDISDPVHPKRIDDVSDPGFSFWHSATFNNDGTKVVFTDEWGGGSQPKCRATDPPTWGADAIFRLNNGRLKFAGYYKMLAPQTDQENCVAHNGGLIPVPGRDIEVQAWYQGGTSIFDFTDPAHPQEIAFFDRGPINATVLVDGGYWSSYWYNGYIYGSEIARGLDVFKLTPSQFLSQNEIDAANLVHFDELNPQSQPKLVWPASFVVARAYIDQLVRSNTLTQEKADALNAAMKQAEDAPVGASRRTAVAQLNTMAAELSQAAATAKGIDASRLRDCAETITKRDAELR